MLKHWERLDNAAKIFPSAVNRADTQVFRFSCELMEPVRRETLQAALEETLKTFEVYRCVLKRGLFWYYLDSSALESVVREEYKSVCAAIYRKNYKGLLFEVTYYGRRINLEVHHALSDGTGAMQFLRQLVTEYLCLAHGLARPPADFDASPYQMGDDSFSKHSAGKRRGRAPAYPRAHRVHGQRFSEDRLQLIVGRLSVRAVLEEAHRCGATLTGYLAACLIEAAAQEMSVREKRRPVVVCVPVNLRKFFESASVRNFFSTLYIACDVSQDPPLAQVASTFCDEMRRMLTPEYLSGIIDAYTAIEGNPFAKIAPLPVKDICLRLAYFDSMKRSTAGLSNLGSVQMPDALAPHIRAFDVCSGTDKIQLCVCSFGDVLSISITSPFVRCEIQRRFFRILTAAGLEVVLAANQPEATT